MKDWFEGVRIEEIAAKFGISELDVIDTVNNGFEIKDQYEKAIHDAETKFLVPEGTFSGFVKLPLKKLNVLLGSLLFPEWKKDYFK